MKFHLVGTVDWSVGSCHDDRSEEINERFNARNEEEGIKKAKVMIEKLHKKNSHLTDYRLFAELHIIKPIWKTFFIDNEPAQPAIKARPARQAVAAHFEEKRLPQDKS